MYVTVWVMACSKCEGKNFCLYTTALSARSNVETCETCVTAECVTTDAEAEIGACSGETFAGITTESLCVVATVDCTVCYVDPPSPGMNDSM